MNEPKYAAGQNIKVRMVVDRATHPGKHPDAKVKGKAGTVKGYGGWNNSGVGDEVNHEYIVMFDDKTVAAISESWLEPA